MTKIEKNINFDFYNKIAELLKNARSKVIQTVNTTMVYTYFEIGRIIIEEEQKGKERAEYGKKILRKLSQKLNKEFGRGFSVDNLENMRKFYLTYSISETSSRKSVKDKSETVSRKFESIDFQLSWSHYLFLMKIGEITHQDLGQMQMYVNYYDRKVKLENENKTIGIILCKTKNETLVEMTLPENNEQIFASKYLTVLPSKEELKKLIENKDDEE